MLTLITMITLTVVALFAVGHAMSAHRGQDAGVVDRFVLGYRTLLGLGASMRPVEHLRS